MATRESHVILLIDDDPGDRELARRCLGSIWPDVELRLVGGGKEELSYLRREGPVRRCGRGAASGLGDSRPQHAELWITDASSGGTIRLADLEPGPASSAPRLLGVAGGKMLIDAGSSAAE